MDVVEKNTTVFAELIQYLDNKSLSQVIRDAQDNGREALTIIKNFICQKESRKLFPSIPSLHLWKDENQSQLQSQ